jgi:hypothetical protein
VARANSIIAFRYEQERRMTFVEDSRALVEKPARARPRAAMPPEPGRPA